MHVSTSSEQESFAAASSFSFSETEATNSASAVSMTARGLGHPGINFVCSPVVVGSRANRPIDFVFLPQVRSTTRMMGMVGAQLDMVPLEPSVRTQTAWKENE